MATRTSTIEFVGQEQKFVASLKNIQRENKQTGESFKALGADARTIFGTGLEQKATQISEAIKQIGGATKLTDAEAKKHLGTLDQWIAKSKALGKEVPDSILSTRAALAGVSSEGAKVPGIFQSIGSKATAIAGAMGIVFSVGAVKSWVENTINAGAQINDLSQKLGVSTRAVQEWQQAAEGGGATIETVDRAVAFMNNTLATGGKSTVAALKDAGLQFDVIRSMKPEDAFNAIAEAVGGIEDPMTRARVAQDLFGKSGQELLPALVSGWDDARKAANVMSDETIQRLAAAEQAWQKFNRNVTIWSGELLGNMMQDLEDARYGWSQFFGFLKDGWKGAYDQGPPKAPKAPAMFAPGAGPSTDVGIDVDKYLKDQEKGLAASKKAADEYAAAMKRVREAEQGAKDAAIPLTAAQRERIDQLVKLGVGYGDIAVAIGRSEVAVKRYAEANKALGEVIKQQIPLLQRSKAALLDALPTNLFNPSGGTIGNLIPLLQRSSLGSSLTDALKRDFAGIDFRTVGAEAAIKRVRQGLQAGIPGASQSFIRATLGSPEQFGQNLASTILGSIQGGGNPVAAAGGMIGSQLMTGWAKSLTTAKDGATAALSGWIGGAASAVLPFVGSLVGPLIDKLSSVFSNLFNRTKGRDMLREFWDTNFGGFAGLQKRLGELGPQGEALLQQLGRVGRNNTDQAKAAIDAITKALEAAEKRQAEFNSTLGGMLGRIKELGYGLPAVLKDYLEQLRDGKQLTQENIDLLAELSGRGTADWRAIQEAVERYGGDISKLGGTFQAQRLSEGFQQLIDDMALFEAGGISAGDALNLTKGKIIELVNESRRFGVDIPANMRPWIQALIDTGELVDDNGQKITDIGKLKFGETLQTSIQKLKDEITRLIDELKKVPGAVGAIPRNVDVEVNYRTGRTPRFEDEYVDPGDDGGATASTGGLITEQGVQYRARGGRIFGRLRGFGRPRGTDRVPVWMTPGEGVLNLDAMKIIGTSGLQALNHGRVVAPVASRPAPVAATPTDTASTLVFDGPRLAAAFERAVRDRTSVVVRAIRGNDRGVASDLFGHGQPVGNF